VYHEHPFAFPPTVSVMRLSQERIPRWSYLRLDQSAYHGWLSMMTSSEGPPFLVLPRAPPTLNPPLLLRTILFYSGHLQHERERPDMERKYRTVARPNEKSRGKNLVKWDRGWWNKHKKYASLRSPM